MSTLIYWGVVLAGACTLFIEANRNFSESLATVPFKEHPILRNVEVARLCTRYEKNAGLAFYSLLYLVTYVVVLSSVEVYELLSQAARTSAEVGPTDDLVGTPDIQLNLSEAGYGKPIFVSATIIAIFSVGALRPVESTMRSLAHRLAGIPRGVYAVIEDLHEINFKTLDGKSTRLVGKLNGSLKLRNALKEDYDTVEEALRTIDHLAPAMTGKLRGYYFPLAQLDAMNDLAATLDEQVKRLASLLAQSFDQKSTEEVDAAASEVFATAQATANDTIALFAINFLRNNRAVKTSDSTPKAIKDIAVKLGSVYQAGTNSCWLSLIVSMVLCSFLAFFLYRQWNPSDDEGVIATLAIRETWPIAFGVALAALSAIVGRDARREDSSWPDWELKRPPVLRLLGMSLVPAALAVLGVTVGVFINVCSATGFPPTQSQLTSFFESNWKYFMLHGGLGLIISVAVLTLYDQHKFKPVLTTVFVGMIFGIISMAYYYVIISVGIPGSFLREPHPCIVWFTFAKRETLIYGSFGFFFLVLFSIFLEMIEDETSKRKNKGRAARS